MMHTSGLPSFFVSNAARMAQEYEGTFELLMIWRDANEEEREEVVAHLQDELDHLVKVCPNCGNNDMLQTVYLVPDEISKLYDED